MVELAGWVAFAAMFLAYLAEQALEKDLRKGSASTAPSLVIVGGTDLDLLRARLKAAERDLSASQLREQELLEQTIKLASQLAREGFRADQLQERLSACSCARLIENLVTKGRA